jgi:aconitate hydratase
MSNDSFGSRRVLTVGPRSYEYFALSALDRFDISRLPYALKILLENLLRNEDGESVNASDIEALATWDPSSAPSR